ncbi:helix-turn-helix transcriptional regulator [Streptomyces sp. G45]|uniref:helix-turn-helix transcriptional regulator n=1 Tax=Streptomyces sp. G45 TaxID=3406627 RepID=UPI003C272F14
MIEAINALMRPVQQEDLPAPADRVRIRKAAGISQTDFGKAIGVSRLSVSMWELGKTEPTGKNRASYMKVLRHIVDTLGIPWSESETPEEQSDA